MAIRNETETAGFFCPSAREYLPISPPSGKLYCPPSMDYIPWPAQPVTLCWNYTEAGTGAIQHCPKVEGMDPNAFVTKTCLADGTWAIHPVTNRTYVNLVSCILQKKNYIAYIYFSGYSASIVALVISLAIFCSFRQLQCDRLTLHKHLFTCYLLNAIIWIILYLMLGYTYAMSENWTSCKIVHLLATYFSMTTYLWMFNEGLYLVVILVVTFIRDTKSLLIICVAVGWGIPFLLTILYGSLRWSLENPNSCWTGHTDLQYIVMVPIIISLSLNFVFVVIIFIVLITKLRNPVSPDQQQGRKAAKAVVILVPLLGIQYIFALVKADSGILASTHEYAVAVMVSFQGLLVAVLFCFLNQEVHSVLGRRINRRRYNYDESAAMNRRVSRAVTYTSRCERQDLYTSNASSELKPPVSV